MPPFKLTFCGDTSLGYYYLEKAKDRYPDAYSRLQHQPASFFAGVSSALEQSTEIVVNLEVVLSNTPGQPIVGKQYPGRDKPELFIPILKQLGVTAVLLANNHTMDFGAPALLDMITQLNNAGIATIGAGSNRQQALMPYVIYSKSLNGKKIYIFNAMLASKRYKAYGYFATETTAGVAEADNEYWADCIMQLRELDPEAIIIICPHWQGIDYKPVKDTHREWCREMILSGADYIVGHGSHTLDEIERFESGLICYSIGNFVFNSPGRFQKLNATPQGLMLSLSAQPDGLSLLGQKIFTDNKVSNFQVSLLGNEHPLSAEQYQPVDHVTECILSINQWLEQIASHGIYYLHGDGNTPCAGFSSSFHDYRPNCFFVFRDNSWPRENHHQLGKDLDVILRKAKQLGYTSFVAPNQLSEAVINAVPDATVLVIDDTFTLVKQAATFMRHYSKCKLVAITGSAGKSSTTAMLQQALNRDDATGNLFAIQGKNRNLFQDTLHSLTKLQHKNHAVLEVSASTKFDKYQFYLSPDIAIFTSLSYAHAEYLGHIADIAMVKSALFNELSAGGTAIINADMPCLDLVIMKAKNASARVILYGESVQADLRLHHYNFENGDVDISFFGKPFRYSMRQLGKHMVLNSMAVLAALFCLGFNWRQHASYLEQFQAEAGKGKVATVTIGEIQITLLDEAYNANPSSMEAALALLNDYSKHQAGRAVAVLADMLELGPQSEKHHAQLDKAVIKAGVQKVYLVGQQMQALWARLTPSLQGAMLTTAEGLAELLRSELKDGDIVLVKGSNAMELGKVIAELKRQ